MLARALILLWLGVLLTPEGHTTTSAAVNKDLPAFKATAYVAKFTGVILDKGYTFAAIEKYDETQNKASLTVIQGDNASSIILNYADQTVADLAYSYATGQASECFIIAMSTAESTPSLLKLKDQFHYFGGFRPSAKGIAHLFSSKYIFTLNDTQSFTYQGTKTIEGINADHWSSSMEWPQDKDKFTVNYYFTPSGWSSSESDDKTKVHPLRIEIVGKKTLSNGSTRDLHHIYDYVDFSIQNYLSPEDFDIPDRDSCQIVGPVKNRTHPMLPGVMSYTREVVDSQGNVDLVDVNYNHKRGIMSFRSVDRFVIYDFNDGVKYDIDFNGACHQSAINPDVDNDAKTKGGYVMDLGPLEFWLLNNSFIYSGAKRTRYIDSSSWIGRINALPFDVHFAKTGWTFRDQKLNQTTLPPLSMTREGKHYNFFAFRSSDDTGFHRRLQYCQSRKERKQAVIVFHQERYYYGITLENLLADNNTYTLSVAIAQGAKVNPNFISISNYESYVKDRHLYLYFKLFGPPAPRNLYQRQNKTEVQQGSSLRFQSSKVSGSTYDEVIDNSAALCEAKTSNGSFNCRNFDLCKQRDGSYSILMYGTLPPNVKTVKSSSCDRFARSVDTKPDISLSKAWSNLQDNVKRGLVKVRLSSSTYRVYSLTAIEAKTQPRSLENDIEDPGFKFSYFRGTGSIEKTEIVSGTQNGAVCAQQCLSRTEYECKAFQYCTGTQQCILSQSNPKRVQTGPKTSCYILTRNYIADFTAMQGVTLTSKGSKLFNNVSNANECARKCMKGTFIRCESFTYCKNSKQCTLSAAHAYGVPSSQVVNASRSCTHYSKNYIFDFKVSKKTTVVAPASYGVEAISVSSAEKCAYLCRTGYDGQGCVQFDFCQDSLLCQIVSNAAQNKVGYKASSTCDVFKLNANLQEKLAAHASPSTSASTFSNASFAGLGVGMVVIGLALGALVIFVLHRTRTLHKIIT